MSWFASLNLMYSRPLNVHVPLQQSILMTDEEFRKLAEEKGWCPEIEQILNGGIPDSQMQILIELGIVGDSPETAETPPIDDALGAQIQELIQSANSSFENHRFPTAIQQFQAALTMLPGNPSEFEFGLHLYTGIGDASFSMRRYADTIEALEHAKKCPGGIGNPFVHLRLGQSYYHEGNHNRAADELMRAYLGAGKNIFDDEEPEYFEFLKTRAEIT